MTPTKLSWFLAVIGLALVAGCSGPTYKTEYYTLIADPEPQSHVRQPYPHSLGVGPVRLPETLGHKGIVSYGEGQRLLIAPYAVWGGDLKDAVSRVLVDDLSSYLATDQVWPFPWDNRMRPDQQITLVFERFAGKRGGEVELQAKWRLVSSTGDEVLQSHQISLQSQTRDLSNNAYVAALNDLLHQLALDIAAKLREVENEAEI